MTTNAEFQKILTDFVENSYETQKEIFSKLDKTIDDLSVVNVKVEKIQITQELTHKHYSDKAKNCDDKHKDFENRLRALPSGSSVPPWVTCGTSMEAIYPSLRPLKERRFDALLNIVRN